MNDQFTQESPSSEKFYLSPVHHCTSILSPKERKTSKVSNIPRSPCGRVLHDHNFCDLAELTEVLTQTFCKRKSKKFKEISLNVWTR